MSDFLNPDSTKFSPQPGGLLILIQSFKDRVKNQYPSIVILSDLYTILTQNSDLEQSETKSLQKEYLRHVLAVLAKANSQECNNLLRSLLKASVSKLENPEDVPGSDLTQIAIIESCIEFAADNLLKDDTSKNLIGAETLVTQEELILELTRQRPRLGVMDHESQPVSTYLLEGGSYLAGWHQPDALPVKISSTVDNHTGTDAYVGASLLNALAKKIASKIDAGEPLGTFEIRIYEDVIDSGLSLTSFLLSLLGRLHKLGIHVANTENIISQLKQVRSMTAESLANVLSEITASYGIRTIAVANKLFEQDDLISLGGAVDFTLKRKFDAWLLGCGMDTESRIKLSAGGTVRDLEVSVGRGVSEIVALRDHEISGTQRIQVLTAWAITRFYPELVRISFEVKAEDGSVSFLTVQQVMSLL